MKEIYIMISQTHTGFAHVLRKVGKIQYNHASIALDRDLNQLYAFARPKHHALLLGRLVRENMCRYTLGKYYYVAVTIFRIEVSEEQYEWIADTIHRIFENDEYVYNLFSVLSTPVTGGFSTYKAFSCIEFIMYILREIGYLFEKPICSYCPDDLLNILRDDICYEGNLIRYKERIDETIDQDYFSPLTAREWKDSACAPVVLLYRLLMGSRLYSGPMIR